MAADALRRNIPEQIANILRQEILSGRLPADTFMRETTLSDRFQVSRGPIRDALSLLAREGIITVEPNKGSRVAAAPSKHLRSLLVSLRVQIETFALETMFGSITKADIATWKEILVDIKGACELGDVDALRNHDIRFHTALLESHDETHLVPLWRPVVMRMMLDYSRHENLNDSHDEHRQILEAIEAGDKRLAVERLKANIV